MRSTSSQSGSTGIHHILTSLLWWSVLICCSVAAQTQKIQISRLPTTTNLPALNATHPSVQLLFPSSPLYLTFNIAALGSNTTEIPTIIVSTEDEPTFALNKGSPDPESGGRVDVGNYANKNGDVWILDWDLGFANWTDTDDDGPINVLVALAVLKNGSVDMDYASQFAGNVAIQVDAANNSPRRSLSPDSIFLGDTTNNAALLFSPLLISQPHDQPTYPNYTLPAAQLPLIPLGQDKISPSQNNLSSLSADLELIIVPTGSSPTQDGLDSSLVAVLMANQSTRNVAADDKMLVKGIQQWMAVGGEEGYRTMWVVGGLTSETNYTAWVVDDQGGMSQPIWFATKESNFPCQLALPNELCPAIGYSAPLTANETTFSLPDSDTEIPFPISTLPDNITTLLTSSLNSFSTSLLSSACGRDLYSHVSTCADCYASYRDWLCRMVVPQCSSSQNNTSPDDISPKTVARTTDSPRNGAIAIPYAYTELLPCLSTCNAADRTCPAFLTFRCPSRGITAQNSYGYLGHHSDKDNGDPAYGQPALDRWGWRWCNG